METKKNDTAAKEDRMEFAIVRIGRFETVSYLTESGFGWSSKQAKVYRTRAGAERAIAKKVKYGWRSEKLAVVDLAEMRALNDAIPHHLRSGN